MIFPACHVRLDTGDATWSILRCLQRRSHLHAGDYKAFVAVNIGEKRSNKTWTCQWFFSGVKKYVLNTAWWFGTCFMFPSIGKNNPNWLIFFRGLKPPTRICFNDF